MRCPRRHVATPAVPQIVQDSGEGVLRRNGAAVPRAPRLTLLAAGLVAACHLAAAGCRDSGTVSHGAGNPPGDSPATAEEVLHFPATRLNAGPYLPPVDEGRVEFVRPDHWRVMPRAQGYLARFYHQRQDQLPRILLTVEPNPHALGGPLSSENVAAFCELVKQQVWERKDLLEPPLAMIIGDVPCVRYVVRASYQGGPAERQIVQTIRDERLYTVDLHIYANTIEEHRDAAYAVVASFRTPSKAPASPPADAPDSPPKAPAAAP